jgi:hypothetical protein
VLPVRPAIERASKCRARFRIQTFMIEPKTMQRILRFASPSKEPRNISFLRRRTISPTPR